MQPATPRTLDQIVSQLAPSYDPQIQNIQQQQAALPGYQQAALTGLSAAKDNAFNDILNGARTRGVGFSGIPLDEQAKYTASTYIPAVAQTQQQFANQGFSLSDAINGLNQDRAKTANSIYDTEQGQYQNYLANLAQSRAAAGGGVNINYGGTGGTTPPPTAGGPQITKKADGGYAFTDASGQPISAATYYAQLTNGQGTNFRGLLSDLAKGGDKGAATALNFIGNDYKYDKSKLNSQALADLYNSLVWGAPNVPQAQYSSPSKPANNLTLPFFNGLKPVGTS